METTDGDVYWINVKNGKNNIIIHNMVRAGHFDINWHSNKWCCAADTLEEVYRLKVHSGLDNTPPQFSWCGKNPSIHELITFGIDI